MGPVSIRAATSADEPFLRAMVYEALFVPPGQPPFPTEVLAQPDISHYYRDFGHRPGDVGRVAHAGPAELIGAAWVRQLTGDDPGYGFVDDETPELTIAVIGTHRGDGIGTGLLADLAKTVPRCSLSVDARNPARRLYERLGFEVVAVSGDSLTMVLTAGAALRC